MLLKISRLKSLSPIYFSIKNTCTKSVNKELLSKLGDLKINTNYLNKSEIDRLSYCAPHYIKSLVENLEKFGLKDKLMANTLKFHDDWSQLTYENLKKNSQMFRELAFTQETYLEMISRNQLLLGIQRETLVQRLYDFKHFFNKKHMEKLFIKSPSLITADFDSFRYKFTYVFVLMKIKQEEMSKSSFFDKPLDTIRERHLFLERSGFYDKPNKKGISKIENPKLNIIMDTNLKEFLRICTRNVFLPQDYETFSDYLKGENFDDELLGNNIGNTLEKQILNAMKETRHEKYLENENDIVLFEKE